MTWAVGVEVRGIPSRLECSPPAVVDSLWEDKELEQESTRRLWEKLNQVEVATDCKPPTCGSNLKEPVKTGAGGGDRGDRGGSKQHAVVNHTQFQFSGMEKKDSHHVSGNSAASTEAPLQEDEVEDV